MSDLRSNFHEQLDEIKTEIARLSAGVTELIPRSTEVLLDGDLEAAEYIILGDDEYDARSVELEEKCFSLIALQAPVAGDLRSLVAAIKIISDVERSGDHGQVFGHAAKRSGHRLRRLLFQQGW